MNLFSVILTTLFTLNLSFQFAQELEINMKKYPVTKSFPRGKRGVIFYGEDPNRNSNQKEIVLVNEDKIQWYSQFMPSNYNVIPLFSNESNYMYFVEEGYIKGGPISYIFLDNSGTPRKGKVNLAMELRKVGVKDARTLDLVRMYSTKNYFTIILEEKSGSEKSFYAINVGHASQRVYPMKFVQSGFDAKEKFKSGMEYIGTSGSKLMFAQRAAEGDFEGFYISFVDPKEGTDETRKFKFQLNDLAKHFKFYQRGVYVSEMEEVNSSTKVGDNDYLAYIDYHNDLIVMAGVEMNPDPLAFKLKTFDVNGNEKFEHRHLLDTEEYQLPMAAAKIKSGTFGFQLAYYKGYYIGAATKKKTFLMFMNDKNGVAEFADHINVGIEKFKDNIYYAFEDLRKKEYKWNEIAQGSLFTSELPIFGKMEFKIFRKKL